MLGRTGALPDRDECLWDTALDALVGRVPCGVDCNRNEQPDPECPARDRQENSDVGAANILETDGEHRQRIQDEPETRQAAQGQEEAPGTKVRDAR